MAEKVTTKEAAQKAYDKDYAELQEVRERTRASKQVLDGFIIRENLAARLGVAPESLEGEDLETLKRIASRGKSQGVSSDGVARVAVLVGEGE
jgi:hypothetical protein